MKPPKLSDLRASTELVAGMSKSTIIAAIDFETYSPAGLVWNGKSFGALPGARKKGLPGIGAARYTEHKETEVLSLAYDLKDEKGAQLWTPASLRQPLDLFAHINAGGLIEAWNCAFEHWVWVNVCMPRYGFPPLPPRQLRDAAAKSRSYALPGGLAEAGEVLGVSIKKDKDGKRLLAKFSVPHNPSKKDPRTRITPKDDPEDAQRLYAYNLRDIETQSEISSRLPDLSPNELEFWFCDQAINYRGVQLDKETIEAGILIVEQAIKKYNEELCNITNGQVKSAAQVGALLKWANQRLKDSRSNILKRMDAIGEAVFYNLADIAGMKRATELFKAPIISDYSAIHDLQAETIETLLKNPELPSDVKRALEIRQLISSASVKKLFAMRNYMTISGRAHDLFTYHGARTGRATGSGIQASNLANHGPAVWQCTCGKYHGGSTACPWCGNTNKQPFVKWNPEAVEHAIDTIRTGSLACVEYHWGNALAVISGCLRGLFIAKPGHNLICSDYSSIEAVVLAAIAGEEWRLEVFRTHGKIYEMSASKITGIPFADFMKEEPHPMRKLGKVAELASGYQGWIGAWKNFGADEYFSDEEIKQHVLAWRAASPQIVLFWAKIQEAAHNAVLNPGREYAYRGIVYVMRGDVLFCRLLSGRYLTYHRPRLVADDDRGGLKLSFEGRNTNQKYGKPGWVRMETYGGKLTENIVQAVARDIFAHAVISLERAGYAIVLHVYDEIVAEIPENWGSIAEFEQIMINLPSWCVGWPIRANGGWVGKRYRK